MRTAFPLEAIGDRPWVPLRPDGAVECIELNLDRDSGARTRLLRSQPRPIIEHKTQSHAGEEEFLVLEGRFTFDGEPWFEPGSYVRLPPSTPHGSRVEVPQGYLLYLRTTERSAADVGSSGLLVTAALNGLEPGANRLLRAASGRPDRVETRHVRAGMPVFLPSDPLPREVLLLRGSVRATMVEEIAAPAYGFVVDEPPCADWIAASDALLLLHLGSWP